MSGRVSVLRWVGFFFFCVSREEGWSSKKYKLGNESEEKQKAKAKAKT